MNLNIYEAVKQSKKGSLVLKYLSLNKWRTLVSKKNTVRMENVCKYTVKGQTLTRYTENIHDIEIVKYCCI